MTTLLDARKALLALVNTLPSPSTYADHAAVVADYLDNQIPLNIENKNLRAQLAARGYTEGFGRVKDGPKAFPLVSPSLYRMQQVLHDAARHD